jgi:hypothetical protein
MSPLLLFLDPASMDVDPEPTRTPRDDLLGALATAHSPELRRRLEGPLTTPSLRTRDEELPAPGSGSGSRQSPRHRPWPTVVTARGTRSPWPSCAGRIQRSSLPTATASTSPRVPGPVAQR